MTHTRTTAELAEHVGGRVVGDAGVVIGRIANLEAAVEGEIAYVEDEKFFERAKASRASCLLVSEKFLAAVSPRDDEAGKAFIAV
ncbi:MAG: LpxD N-terminal domain-containing protein, partial [Pyrinomonadaceae bacterium]